MREENPGAAEVWFKAHFEFLFPTAGRYGKNGTQISLPLPNSTSHQVTSDKTLPLSAHMPPSLENGANAYFPELLGAPDGIIYETVSSKVLPAYYLACQPQYHLDVAS